MLDFVNENFKNMVQLNFYVRKFMYNKKIGQMM